MPLSSDATLERLATAGRWFSMTQRGPRHSRPSRDIAGPVHERVIDRGLLPPLRGIIESPVMRADGSIVMTEGYDAATGLYYAPHGELHLPDVRECPTRDEVEQAVMILLDPLCGFDFETDREAASHPGADRANVVAFALTLPLRELIDGPVPALGLDAPAAGSGKGLLADYIAILATGETAPVLPWAFGNEEEVRKQITAELLTGRQIHLIDNLDGVFGSGVMAALLTSRDYSDRKLGFSLQLRLANTGLWILTGNNLHTKGDLYRRIVRVRIDPGVTHPEDRPISGFTYPDLRTHIREQRRLLLWACFVIGRAYLAAGRPKAPSEVPAFGSFESWREVLGGSLEVAGVPGFLSNLVETKGELDEETREWSLFVTFIHERFGIEWFTAKKLAEAIWTHRHRRSAEEVLPDELLRDHVGSGFTRRLGWALRARVGRPFPLLEDGEGRTAALGKPDDSTRGGKRWRLEVAERG